MKVLLITAMANRHTWKILQTSLRRETTFPDRKLLLLVIFTSLCSIHSMFLYYLGRVMRKRVLGHMRTAKAQISLLIRAV